MSETRSTPTTGVPVVDDFDPLEHESHAFFARARRETPVFFHRPTDAYWVTRYADCDASWEIVERTSAPSRRCDRTSFRFQRRSGSWASRG
jgi:hypothetical protein